jgi:hypothetical protein
MSRVLLKYWRGSVVQQSHPFEVKAKEFWHFWTICWEILTFVIWLYGCDVIASTTHIYQSGWQGCVSLYRARYHKNAIRQGNIFNSPKLKTKFVRPRQIKRYYFGLCLVVPRSMKGLQVMLLVNCIRVCCKNVEWIMPLRHCFLSGKHIFKHILIFPRVRKL